MFADYLTNDSSDANNGRGDLSAWKVGGKYTLNNFAVMGQYEGIEQGIFDDGAGTYGTGKQEGTWWHVAGSYTMGNNMVYLGYGAADFDDVDNYATAADPDDLENRAVTLAGTHKLSKRTTLYAAYSTQTQEQDDAINTSNSGVSDVDKDIFGVGMKHKF